jgi:hypothetical protein
MFLYTIDSQQSSLVCCRNDTLACSNSKLPFSVSVIVNVMCLVVPEAACLLILCSLAAIIIAHWAEWNPYYKMWDHTISMRTGRYQYQSFWNHGLKYQDFWIISSTLKELYCISEALLDVLLFEVWFVIENLFPQKAIVLLVLESDRHSVLWIFKEKLCSIFITHHS